MIVQLRIDDRLIHGQVALVWSKELNTTHIVVANNQAAGDAAMKMTLKMAAPSDKKVLIQNVDNAIKVFNDPRAENLRILALVNTVADALKIAGSCKDIQSINVANVGRFDANKPGKKYHVTDWIILGQQEFNNLKKLSKLKLPVYTQVVPSNPKKSIAELIKDFD